MGGTQPGSRRLEISQDLDSYISGVRKRKPFSIAGKGRSWSFWPIFARKDKDIVLQPSARQPHSARTLPGERVAVAAASFWEGIKTSMRDTVRKDLERINNQTGVNKMRQDDDFIDFEDGGLKVVPIPDELEPSRKTAAAPHSNQAAAPQVQQAAAPIQVKQQAAAPVQVNQQAEQIMLDPFADDPEPTPEPAKKKQGFFSRIFTKKKAVKEEEKFDEDFLIKATSIAVAPAEDKELKEDFKELAKLFLKNLERMNKDQLSAFKSTEDFERFKTLLKKHNVIK